MFDLFERNIERLGDGFLHQALTQADAEIACQNLDDVLSFTRGQNRKSLFQKLCLRDWAARALKILEQLGRLKDAEWMRCRSPVEDFKSGFASVAVPARDAVKFSIADSRCVLQPREDYRPSDL